MSKQRTITYASFTGIGKKANNEDTYLTEIHEESGSALCMVCDGVGGQNKGEIASALLIASFKEYMESHPDLPDESWVQKAIKYAEARFDAHTQVNPDAKGMASTLALLYMHNDEALIAHCGDSRVYHFREEAILFQTKDHSYVNWMIDRGEITMEQVATHPKKNVITRCISGSGNPTQAEIHHIKDLHSNDYFLLCTDGVLEAWNNRELARLMLPENNMQTITDELQDKCSLLSIDNYTAISIKIIEQQAL
jgi:protein phosphatase